MRNHSITVQVCMGTGGIASGGADVLAAFRQEIEAAGLSADIRENCSTHQVGCRGLCAKDVLVDVLINGEKVTYQFIKADMVARIVREHIIEKTPVREWTVGEDYHAFHKKQVKVVLSDCGRLDPESIDDYIAAGGYEAARTIVSSWTPEQVINEVKASGLRGRGGGVCRPRSAAAVAGSADQRLSGALAGAGGVESQRHRHVRQRGALLGRDLLTRCLYGGRISLLVGALVMMVTLISACR